MQRDGYGAIILQSIPQDTQENVRSLVNAASNAAKLDEHGGWEFGAEFDNKGRGYALNWDLYGFGFDVHDSRFLAVIQVRQYVKARKNGFGNVRKSYFLLGTNEDGTTFAHPVSAMTVHHAIKVGDDVVKRVQDWIFGGDYAGMIRQGDLALIPIKKAVGERTGRRAMLLEKSHKLNASAIRQSETALYAKSPSMVHTPGTHPPVSAEGWCKIITGKRSRFWSFAVPTID